MSRHITRAQAEECLGLVRAYVQRIDPDRTPLLNDPGHEGDFYSINVEECGEAYDVSCNVTWPAGVHASPINNCAIGLHPDVSRETSDDPYVYGATWISGDSGRAAQIVATFEDIDGLIWYRERGAGMVVVAMQDDPQPVTWPVSIFLTLFHRPDGSSPAPTTADMIPGQRSK